MTDPARPGAAKPDNETVRSALQLRRNELQSEVDAAWAALAQIRAMRSERIDDDEHDPDGAPLSEEWLRLDGLHRAAVRRLTDIDAAIANLDGGQYGICSRCGRRISAGRLEVMPAASQCVQCATISSRHR